MLEAGRLDIKVHQKIGIYDKGTVCFPPFLRTRSLAFPRLIVFYYFYLVNCGMLPLVQLLAL